MKKNKFTYINNKNTYNKGVIEYLLYVKFIIKNLKELKPSRIIVFGIQLTFFLQDYLNKFTGKYIIDIRDYHKLIQITNNKIFKLAMYVAISSPGFKSWLPQTNNFLVSYNLNMLSYLKLKNRLLVNLQKIIILAI